jgi:hypothetical protein
MIAVLTNLSVEAAWQAREKRVCRYLAVTVAPDKVADHVWQFVCNLSVFIYIFVLFYL